MSQKQKEKKMKEKDIKPHHYGAAVVVLVIALGVVIASAAALWQANRPASKTLEQVVQTRTTNNSTSGATKDDKDSNTNTPEDSVKNSEPYADWRTYTNKHYGYSLMYPADWRYDFGVKESNGITMFENKSKPITLEGGNFFPIKVIYYANPSNKPWEEYFDGTDWPEFENYESKTNITVDGKDAVKFEGVQGLVNFTEILITIDGGFIEIEKPEDIADKSIGVDEAFDGMLATMKFTD